MRPILAALVLLVACSGSEPSTPSSTALAVEPPAPTPAATPPEAPGEVADPSDAAPSPGPAPTGQKRWLGLPVASMKEPIPGVATDERCLVDRALRGGPAWKAGIRAGDVLVGANGSPVKICKDYLSVARTVPLGGQIGLSVRRGGQRLEFRVDVVQQPADEVAFRKAQFPGTEGVAWELASLRPKGTLSTAKARGKVQVLYFWATWCGPCRQTAPMVDALWKELGPEKVFVAAISNEELQVIEGYLSHSTQAYPVVHDQDSTVKRGYEVSKLPSIVLVGKDGRIVRWETSVSGVRSVLDEARRLAG